MPYYALWRAIAVHNIIFTEKSCLILKWYKSSYKVIVLFSTKAFMKIKLKCGKTFIKGKKKQEMGKDTKDFVFKETSGSHT